MDAAVAIVGAGPAGCAAALTLRRYVPELSTVVIAAPAGGRPPVGETLSPGVLPLLAYLGIDAEFRGAGHLPAGGTASAWGSGQVMNREYVFTGRGLGWHLDRDRFDAWLLECVEAAGARVLEGRARTAGRDRADWALEVDGGGTVTARAIVDATGRPAQLSGRPRRDDALVAQVGWYEHDERHPVAEGALVESVADGWWYSATLPEGRAVAMFMTDADLRHTSPWDARLGQAPATAERVEHWRATGETATRAAHSQLTPAPTADGRVATGDAAAAFDPISALGIGFSLRSGIESARVAAAVAEDEAEPAAAYAASIERIYREYRSRLAAIYDRERRWPDSPFWARRAARSRSPRGVFG
jgi:flavin-dependent dehydrogenase